MVDIDTDEVKIGAATDFDYDTETQIRWRGIGHAPTLGACCYIDPSDPDMATTICDDGMTVSDCNALSGDFAPNMSCTDDPCPGACCEDDGSGGFTCEDLSQSDCDAAGGDFKGVNTACADDPDPCIVGVCCLSSGCFDQDTYPSQSDCESAGGTWVEGASCTDDPDPCLGACCILDIDTPCQDLNESDCDVEDGGFQGVGTSCPDDACDAGACCFDDGSPCEIETSSGCGDLGGTFQGSGVSCTPDPCPEPTGACCDGDVCSEETEEDCVDLIGGEYQGDDVPCDPNPCTVTGACCQSDGVCSDETVADCRNLGGTYQGDDVPCNPCVCPSISMVCDSAAASGSKCGATNANDGKVYKTQITGIHPVGGTHFHTNACALGGPDGGVDGPENTDVSWDVYRLNETIFTDAGGTCISSSFFTCGGSSSYSGDNPDCLNCGDFQTCDYSSCTVFDVGAGPPACSWAADEPCIFIILPTGCKAAVCVYSNRGGTPQFDVLEYDDEYTTEELISNVTGRLSYSGDYTGGACASSRFLSSDERTYSVQRSRPRFLFGVVLVNFTLTYDEVLDGSVIATRSFNISPGQTSVDGPELFEPPSNGTISIQNIRCTLT